MAALNPAHLRVDIHLADDDREEVLRRAVGDSERLEIPLEAALFLTDEGEAELLEFSNLLNQFNPRLVRCLIFHVAEKVSGERWLKLARQILGGCGAAIGGGTNADFYQLNQCRPRVENLDFVSFSINPQVHASDDFSLVETPSAIPYPIESAKRFFGGLPVVVSPITLKPRFNPVAVTVAEELGQGGLPSQVDARQMSLLGAAWTLASLKGVAQGGASSVTYYETTGWRGLMETETGSPSAHDFPSLPGSVFPLYHVLADACEYAGGRVTAVESSDPFRSTALLLSKGKRKTLLLANLTDSNLAVAMNGIGAAPSLRRLNESNAENAMREPELFRLAKASALPRGDLLELTPYEIVRLEWR